MSSTVPQTRKTTSLLRDGAALYGSTYVAVFFRFAQGFAVAWLLGPALYGLRTVFGLVVDYERFSHLGTFNAMHKEIPYHRGRGDYETAERIGNTVYGVNLAYAIGLSALLLVAAVYVARLEVERIIVDFLIFFAAFVVVSRIRSFYGAQLIVDKNSVLLGKVRALQDAVAAAASVVLVYLWSLRGLFIALFIANLISLAFIRARTTFRPRFTLDFRLAWRLVGIGFPIMLITLSFILLRSVDKLLIAGMLSREALGLFAVAAIVSAILIDTIVDVVTVMSFPRIMERLGQTGDRAQLRPYLEQPTVLIAYFTPFLIAALYLGVHLPLQHFAPEYLPSVGVARILVLGHFFFAVTTTGLATCVALNEQLKIVALTVLSVALNAAVNVVVIRAGWGIEGVALGTGLSYLFFGSSVLWYAMRRIGTTPAEYFAFSALVYLPFAWTVLVLAGIDRLIPSPPVGLAADLAVTASKYLLFVAAYAPILLRIRRHPAFATLRSGVAGLLEKRLGRRGVDASAADPAQP